MTTSIMNKISAAFSLKCSTESTSDQSCSKKNDNQDEYNTIFTRRLSNESNSKSPREIDEDDHHNHCSLDDFIGGPIDDEKSLNSPKNTDQNDGHNRSITATPADSSCGFHNTFSVLEKHLNKNNYLKLSQKQIENLLLKNNDLVVHNDTYTYIDIPINDHRSLRDVNGLSNSCMNDVNVLNSEDEEYPSHLELELEAMDRLRSVWNKDMLANSKDENEKRESSHTPFDSSLIEEFYQQDEYSTCVQNSNEYIYHVAKSRDGQLYIRVRRNLRLDQGEYIKLIFHCTMNFYETLNRMYQLNYKHTNFHSIRY